MRLQWVNTTFIVNLVLSKEVFGTFGAAIGIMVILFSFQYVAVW
jgi:hypothetical protein